MRRGKPLRQVGRRALRDADERAEMRRVVIGECGDRCVARVVLPEIRCYGFLEVHELVDRSVRPGVQLDADFAITACRPHHEWISADASRARDDGLSFFSWDWEQALARVKELRTLSWRS